MIKRNAVFVGLAVIAVLAVAGLISFSQFSIIGAPATLQVGGDGKLWWQTSLTINQIDQVFHVYGASTTLANGTKVTPNAAFDITLRPKDTYCRVSLVKQAQYSYLGTFAYYTPSAPEKHVSYYLSSTKGGVTEKVVDAANIGEIQTLSDPDGKGQLFIKNLGFLQGVYECPSYSDVAVLSSPEGGGTARVVSRALLISTWNAWTLAVTGCIGGNPTQCALASNYGSQLGSIAAPSGFYGGVTNSQISITNLQMLNYLKSGFSGSAVVNIQGSTDYFDSVWYNPPTPSSGTGGTPQVVSVSSASAYSGSYASVTARVKNLAGNPTYFTVSGSVQAGSITGGGQLYFTAGETKDVVFQVQAPQVYGNPQTYSATVRACFNGEFGSSVCDEKQATITANPMPTATAVVRCGDGVCQREAGETQVNCPQDCGIVISCGDNEVKGADGVCYCVSGFVWQVDSSGKRFCGKQAFDWTLIAIIAVAALVVYLLATRKKSGKSGGLKVPDVQEKYFPFIVAGVAGVGVWWWFNSFTIPFLGAVFAGFAWLAGVIAFAVVYLLVKGSLKLSVF